VNDADDPRAESRFAGLHALADDDPRWPNDPVAQAAAACAGGASVVQLRCKHASDREALDWARAIRRLTRRAALCFVVNDRFDLALAAEADAVHLGQDDLPPERVRSAAGAALAIGRSTHDETQLARACAEPVDYVAYGPVFGTRSKESRHAPRGVEALAAAAKAVAPRPLVAIGGISAGNLSAVLRAGAAGVAVISAIAAQPEPERATRELVGAIERARGGGKA